MAPMQNSKFKNANPKCPIQNRKFQNAEMPQGFKIKNGKVLNPK